MTTPRCSSVKISFAPHDIMPPSLRRAAVAGELLVLVLTAAVAGPGPEGPTTAGVPNTELGGTGTPCTGDASAGNSNFQHQTRLGAENYGETGSDWSVWRNAGSHQARCQGRRWRT